MAQPKIGIVDGNNLAYRVYMAYPELNTSKGKSVTVIYGLLKVLRATIQQHKLEKVLLTWDDTPAVRKKIYPDYKEHRVKQRAEETPEQKEAYKQYKVQMNDLALLLPHFGVHQYKGVGVEADDLVAVLAEQSTEPVLVISEDKDFLQLVSDKVTVHRPITNKTYTPENFAEQVGIATPRQYLHARVLIGDSSDGIPGVHGIGEGIAFKLLSEHRTLQNIFASEELRNSKSKRMATLFESRKLVTRNLLLMDLEHSKVYVDEDLLADCERKGKFDEQQIKAQFLKYEFFSFMRGFQDFLVPFSTLS